MNKFGVIYKWENLINGKVYIGKAKDIKVRYRRHIWLMNNQRGYFLHNGLRKYGLNNFSFEIICCSLSENYTNELEIKLIHQYESNVKGYNLTEGGEGSVGFVHSKESITKMKLLKSGNNNPMFGKSITEEHRNNLSKAKSKSNHPMFGKTHSEEAKQKISIAFSDGNHPLFGKKHSKESIEKMRLTKLGKPSKRKGIRLSEEEKNNLRETRRINKLNQKLKENDELLV